MMKDIITKINESRGLKSEQKTDKQKNTEDSVKITFESSRVWDIETILCMMRWYYVKCANSSEKVFLKKTFKSIYDDALKNPDYKEYFNNMDQRDYADGDIDKAKTWPSALS